MAWEGRKTREEKGEIKGMEGRNEREGKGRKRKERRGGQVDRPGR